MPKPTPRPRPPTQQLFRWMSPAPAELRHLLPRFERESRRRFARLLVSAYTVSVPFFAFYYIVDFLLYGDVALSLALLRAALLGVCVWGLLFFRREESPTWAYAAATGFFQAAVLVIVGMVMVIGDPGGLYGLSLFGVIPLLALLPAPLLWFLGNAVVIVLIYLGGAAISGWLGGLEAWEMIGGLSGAICFFGAAQHYLERQRWENFVTRVDLEHVSRQLQSELALARRIQRSLLPPPEPGWPRPEIVCWSEPAREVGGDFYSYLSAPDGRVGLAVGDVSGKGMPAALLMSTSLAYLRAAAHRAESPAALLRDLDQALGDTTRATRQNCALCLVELAGSRLRAANAGGVAPLLRRADGSVQWIDAAGLPLGTGLGGKLGYQDVCAELAPGDLLVLVSDGVVEAMSEGGELFGFERLEQALARVATTSAFVALAELRECLAQFVGMAENHDDMTIAMLRVP